MASTLYLMAGEKVTCENGHVIADVVRNVFQDEMPSVLQFARWRNVERKPEKGDKPQDMHCTSCGGIFCLAGPFTNAILHVGNKWRCSRPSVWGLSPDQCSASPNSE